MKFTSSYKSETELALFAPLKARPFLSTLFSIIFALAFVCGLFYAYLYLRNRHVAQLPLASKASVKIVKTVLTTATPQAQIAQDETWAKNGQAIIGGAIRNISHNKLNDLSLEVEMKRRANGQTEKIDVEVVPKNLEPEGQGKFSLRVPSGEYSGLRILRLRDGANSNIAFSSVPGTPRPLERAPAAKVIIIQRPAPRTRGDEFLNTPENPEVIR